MLLMAVHAPVGDQPQQMQSVSARPRKRILEHRAFFQLALFDRLVDPGQILVHDPARAEVEVAHLGVFPSAREGGPRPARCAQDTAGYVA